MGLLSGMSHHVTSCHVMSCNVMSHHSSLITDLVSLTAAGLVLIWPGSTGDRPDAPRLVAGLGSHDG